MKRDGLSTCGCRAYGEKLLKAFFLAALLAGSAGAQSPNQIFGKYVKAIGGEKALRQINSWRVKGAITRQVDGSAGRYEASAMHPNLYASSLQMGAAAFETGFNGK